MEEQERLRREKRAIALKTIIEARGFGGILELVRASSDFWAIGILLAQERARQFDAQILPTLLVSENRNESLFAGAYAANCARLDRAWAEQYPRAGWTVDQEGTFLAYLPFDRQAWDFVHVLGDAVERAYWQRTEQSSMDLSAEDLEFAAYKLLDAERVSLAIEVVSMNQRKGAQLGIATLMAFLERVAVTPFGREHRQLDGYHIQQLIERLQKDHGVDEDRLAKLEWAYSPLLNRTHCRRTRCTGGSLKTPVFSSNC